MLPLQKCDTDYEADASAWFENVLKSLSTQSPVPAAVPSVKKTTGKKNFTGMVLTNTNLSGHGSAKQTHHIEIAAEDVVYQPGDSLGVVPENPAEIVDSVIELVKINKSKRVMHRDEESTVFELLKKKLNIVYLPERVVKKYGTIVSAPAARQYRRFSFTSATPSCPSFPCGSRCAIASPL